MKIRKIGLIAILFLLLIPFNIFAQEKLIDNLKFKDADIRLVLEAIGQKAYIHGKKVNIIMSPEVQGTISLELEKVDWQTALSVVLNMTGYGRTRYRDVIIVAPVEKIKEVEKNEKDRMITEPAQIKVFRLKYIDANDAKKSVEPLLSAQGKASVLELTDQTGWEFVSAMSGQAGGSSAGTVTGAAGTTAGKISRSSVLIVSDISRKIDEIAAVLEEIDVLPMQILIKARIMEVNRDFLRDIGFDWGTGTGGAEVANTPTDLGLTRNNKKTLAGRNLGSAFTPGAFNPIEGTTTFPGAYPYKAGLEMIFKKLGGTQFEIILHALEEDVRTKTLSAPVILALNNQEAKILVGTKYPIITTQSSTQTTYTTGSSLSYYQDIGIQLRVIPQIWGDKQDLISMIIHPAVTSYTQTVKVNGATTDSVIAEYPIINSQEAKTQLVIKDAETIVMGGLFKDINSDEEIGIPFLSKIPWLGNLFIRKTHDIQKVDLLIFITAKIVKPGEIIPQEILNTAAFYKELESKEAKK